jgi:ribosomal protein S18 acetylase RimI-like enzyme
MVTSNGTLPIVTVPHVPEFPPAPMATGIRTMLLPSPHVAVMRVMPEPMSMSPQDALELLLIAVDPEYRNKGVHVLLFNELIPQLIKNGFKYGESNAEMESNNSVQNLWNQYRKEFKRRRRVFSKEI